MGVQCSESDEAARRVFLILYVPAVSKARIPLGEEGRGKGEGEGRCAMRAGLSSAAGVSIPFTPLPNPYSLRAAVCCRLRSLTSCGINNGHASQPPTRFQHARTQTTHALSNRDADAAVVADISEIKTELVRRGTPLYYVG